MDFTATIDDDVIARLDRRIAEQLRGDPEQRAKLAKFALDEVLGWMSGATSYQSITQQQTEWLTALLPTFFPDKPPTASQIFNSFSVPYGRAAYISRVLMETQNSQWRKRGRADLLAALRLRQGEARKNLSVGEGRKTVTAFIDGIASRELTVLVDDLFIDSPGLEAPTSRQTSPGRYSVEMTSTLCVDLIARLESAP